MADELLGNYPDDIASLTLQPGHKGVFKVAFDDRLQFDKKELGRFPDASEVIQKLMDYIG